jgi:hypothetical protein
MKKQKINYVELVGMQKENTERHGDKIYNLMMVFQFSSDRFFKKFNKKFKRDVGEFFKIKSIEESDFPLEIKFLGYKGKNTVGFYIDDILANLGWTFFQEHIEAFIINKIKK